MTTTDSSRQVPFRALLLSLGSLAVPVAGSLAFPEWTTDAYGILLWMSALVPAFLLTFYRGWQGASVALALGMAVLSLTQVVILLLGMGLPDWRVLGVLVLVYMGICFGIGFLAELLHRERRAAERMALTDPLTELPNRRHARIFLDTAVAAAERGIPASVVLFDLDHFKRFNDAHGHAAGDEVLRRFATILSRSTRRANLSARWGGEEFIAILSNCHREGAGIFAKRILQELAGAELPWGRVTASAGVAQYEDGMGSPDVLVAAADRALYAAKEGGRNRCETAPPATDVEPRAVATTPGPRRRRRGLHGTATILVVDDDPDARRGVRRLLERLDHRVLEAETGRRALAILEERGDKVDLLVTDIVMPDVNGLSLVEKASALRPDLPVIYVSGYLHGDVSWPGVPGTVTAFLEKPLELVELAATVEEVLGDSEAKSEGDQEEREPGGEEEPGEAPPTIRYATVLRSL